MKKLTIIAALAVSLFGFAGAAQAQHYGHGGYGHGGYNHGWHGNRGGGVGIDIIIGGGRGWGGGWDRGGWDRGDWNRYPRPYPGDYNMPRTRVVYETVQDRFYDEYSGRWIYRGTRTISHIARFDPYYRGYVWYDVNGRLRVN